ncbi:MAG: TolC family outer membrane protein [Candidatus Nitrospinota bacterium M3_3B_026]
MILPKTAVSLMAGLLIAFSASSASGSETGAAPMGLAEALELARENDAGFAADKARRAATVEKPVQGRAGLMPSVGVSGDAFYTDLDTEYGGDFAFGGGRVQYGSMSYSLSLRQPVFHLENIAAYRQAKIIGAQADTILDMARQNLILRVAEAYFNALLARDKMEFIVAEKNALSEQLAKAKKSFEVGAASITDTYEAQARYDMVTSREAVARHDLEVSRHALERIIGVKARRLSKFPSDFEPSPLAPDDIDAWAARAEKDNLRVKMRKQALEAATQEVAKIQGERAPSLDLVANYTESTQDNSSFGVGIDSTSGAIGLKLSMPIFTGGALSSRIREARANEEKNRHELEDALREANLMSRRAFLQVKSSIAEIRALRQTLKSTKVALDSTMKGLDVGLRNEVDVLDAQKQFFDAKHSLARAKYSYLLSHLNLEASVGGLSESDVEKISDLYLAGR